MQHAPYLTKTLNDINGDLETFNKNLTTGGTVQEGYNKVQESWAMQLDKMSASLKALGLMTADSAMENSVGTTVKLINELLSSIKGTEEITVGGRMAFSALADTVSIGSVAMILNLTKVKGMFGALKTSIMTLNPVVLSLMVGVMALQAVYAGFKGYADEQERLAEKSLQQAKAMEDANKKLKEAKEGLGKLKSEMDKMALDEFNYKWKNINTSFMESLTSIDAVTGALKALNDLKTTLQIGIDYKRFEKESQRIIERVKITAPHIEALEKRDKTKSWESIGDKGGNYNIYASAYDAYETDISEKSSRGRVRRGDRGALAEEANIVAQNEIDRKVKEANIVLLNINNIRTKILKEEERRISLGGVRNADIVKYRSSKDINEQEAIATRNKWSPLDLQRKLQEDMEIESKRKPFTDNINKYKNILKSMKDEMEGYGISYVSVWQNINKATNETILNISAEQSARVEMLKKIEESVELVAQAIEEVELKQALAYIKLKDFKNVADFSKGLDSVGLSEYNGLLKEFGGIIDSFTSQGAKMEFLNGKFLEMAGNITKFKEGIESAKEARDYIGVEMANLKAGTRGESMELNDLYAFLKKQSGGISGKKAMDILNQYDTETGNKIRKMSRLESSEGKWKERIEMEKINAKIQQTSYVQLEKYNSSIDSQLLSLNKINASKMESLKIDRDLAKIQYDLTKNKQSEVVTDTISSTMNDFIDLRKRNKNKTFATGDVLDLSKLQGYTDVQKGKNVTKKTDLQLALGNLDNLDLDFSSLDSLNKFIKIVDNMDATAKLNTSEQKLVDKANTVRTEMLKSKEAEVKYAEDLMVYEKGSYEAFQAYFTDYLDYISKVGQESKVLEYKKSMLEKMAENAKVDNKETEESLSFRIQAFKIQDELNEKNIESAEKLLSINAEIEKYNIKRQMYFGSDLTALQLEYEFNKKNLQVELDRLKAQKESFTTNFTSPKLIQQNLDLIKGKVAENRNTQSKIEGSTDKKDTVRLAGLKEQELTYVAEQAMLEELISMSASERSKALSENVKYREILAKLSKAEFESNELDINNWKEKLRIEYELRDIAYDMKTIQSDTERERSRNLYKEVFGNQTFDEAESKANIEKAKQLEINAVDKVEKFKLEAFKNRVENQVKFNKLNSKETLTLEEEQEKATLQKVLNSSLDENVEVQNAIKLAQEAGYNVLKATNEEELKRIQYLRQQVESVLDIVDALSKGEGIKFNPSQAIKGASGAFTKIYANSQEKDPSKKQKLTGKDYADIAVAGVGVVTNIVNQAYDSQMNVINAELSNLELRKQLAKNDKERQQIDEEILNKQKQQIDLEYKKSTQTMGITGSAGSALGGAMSGAMLGGQIGGAYGAAIGGGLGLISGIFGGNSAKKAAEQQKKQLEAQLRANQYLDSLQKLQSANNELIKSVFDSTAKGIGQALTDAFKEFRKTQADKGVFDVNENWITDIANDPKQIQNQEAVVKAFNLNSKLIIEGGGQGGAKYTYYETFAKDFEESLNNSITSIQDAMNGLSFSSSISDITAVTNQIEELQTNIKAVQGALGDQTSDEMLLKQLDDWQLYLETLTNIAKKVDVFYAEYFGFAVDYIETDGMVTDVARGEWEKRTSFLDSFVESALGGTNKISKAVANLTIEGFANAFIRNNTEISDSLKKLETGILDFSTFMATGQSIDFNKLTGVTTADKQADLYKLTEVTSLVQISKELTGEQEKSNLAVQEFASLWVKAGGSIEDIIDMMPEFTKTLQTAMQNSLSETDYEDRFNSIGSALKSTIETKLNEVSFAKLQEQFISTNSSLASLMSGDLTMNNMAQLSQGIAKYTTQAEQSAYKTKAMLDMLQLDQTVDYGVSNTQVEYKTGSTNTNVYNINNNVTTTIGNLLGDARAMQNFTDSIVGYMVESMQKQGVLKK